MKTILTAFKWISASCACLLMTSCAGVNCGVRASRIDQPVSFTPCVYDAGATVVKVADEDALKHFKIRKRFWAMLWGNVDLTDNDWDLSDELSQEIESVDGDAIVNLTIVSQGDWLWFISSLLPIIPDYHTITIEGDVARVRSGKVVTQ